MRICFFDTKAYDKNFFDEQNKWCGFDIKYFEEKLNKNTAAFASNADVVCAFVNDDINSKTIDVLVENGVKLIAMRCAGFNNIDIHYARGKIDIVRVESYSPNAVAEHAMGLLLAINRKLHRAYNRTRDFNFSLNGLTGYDLCGKTVGVIGTGRIGQSFIRICHGFEMNVIAYDPYKIGSLAAKYVSIEDLFGQSDIISLHCPLTKENYHIIDKRAIKIMKNGVSIINTSRGALIDSEALLEGLIDGKIGSAGLDVYEEEADMFYEDNSDKVIRDRILPRLLSQPNVLLTSHQGFFTKEALSNIAKTTLFNIKVYFSTDEKEKENIGIISCVD